MMIANANTPLFQSAGPSVPESRITIGIPRFQRVLHTEYSINMHAPIIILLFVSGIGGGGVRCAEVGVWLCTRSSSCVLG
jgi:hypothetical protein